MTEQRGVWKRLKRQMTNQSNEEFARFAARVPSSTTQLAPAVVELYDRMHALEREITQIREQLRVVGIAAVPPHEDAAPHS